MKRAAALFLVLAAGASCARTPTPGAGEFRVTPLAGDVRIVDGGEISPLDDAATVDSGVGLRTGLDGWAQVELPDGNTVELAPETALDVEGSEPSITKGSALVRSASDITIHAGSFGETEIIASDAVFRVKSDISVILAVYQGEASVLGSGVDAVPALRQATIVQGGDIFSSFKPIEVNRNDPWDAELLGDAIDLGLRLAGLERGLTRQLPSRDEAGAVSRVLGQDFRPGLVQSAIRSLGDAARAVVAAVVAQQAARVDGVSLARAFSAVVDFWVDGARWMVVAARWGLAQAAGQLLENIGDLATVIVRSVAPPIADVTGPTGQQVSRRTPPATSPGANGQGPGGAGNDNNPSNESNKTPPPAPPTEGEDQGQTQPACASEVDCAVEEILGDGGPGTPGRAPLAIP